MQLILNIDYVKNEQDFFLVSNVELVIFTMKCYN